MNTKPTRKPPVTAHPWFPALLALWFAALLGLCTLAAGPALLERAVLAVGLDRLVPAAAPPLGATARMLAALGLAVLGSVVGLALGRRLAPPAPTAYELRVRARQPAEPVAAAPDRAEESPALAQAEESTPVGACHEPEPPAERAALAEPLPAEPIVELIADPVIEADEGDAWAAPIEQPVDKVAEPEWSPPLEPTVRAAEPEPPLDFEPAAPPAPPPPARVPAKPKSPVAYASLDSLGTVQLVERLASAMQARDARVAEYPDGVDPLGGQEAEDRAREILAQRTPKPRPSLEPDEFAAEAADQPFGDDDDEEDEGDASDAAGYSSLLAIGPSVSRAASLDEDEDAEPVVVFPGQAARAAAAARPLAAGLESGDQACDHAADPADTERALREALASLQRISNQR